MSPQTSNRNPRLPFWSAALGALLTVGACSGQGHAAASKEATRTTAPPTAAPPAAAVTPRTEKPQVARMLSSAFATTARALRPSVVRIDVEKAAPRVARGDRGSDDQLPEPFRRFFFNFGPMPDLPESPLPMMGTGSGFLFDASGDVLTNSHAVEGGDRFKVTLSDGQEVPAKVVGADRRTDVAVIRLEKVPRNLTAARLGDSNKLEVGEWVLAIGSPLGLEQTVTAGIVSGKGRVGRHVQMSGDRVREYIQTDAKINPGNSGGPLVNLDGEVVGMNTLIRAGAGGAYGFAVPINEAYRVAQALLKEGRVKYPYLGVNLRDVGSLEPAAREKLGKNAPEKGAYVAEVTPASPAAGAGVEPGDIITRIDDRRVEGAADVVEQVSSRGIGAGVTLQVLRDGNARTLRATLAEAPGDRDAEGALGLALQTLTPSLARSMGLDAAATHGVVITDVAPGSRAEQAELQPGEIILEIDRKPVTTADQAVTVLRGPRSGGHLLRIRGTQGTRFVTIGGG
jgi:serine protease Do